MSSQAAVTVRKARLRKRLPHLAVALLLFAVLYTLTNEYSAALFSAYPERIHTLALPLDADISFTAAMIIPYSWSLILFVAGFFLVRTSRQLSQLTSRLILATLLACLIFYLYPARFSFVRPVTSDWTAFGYQFLQLTDKPYNQLPSLHVSYALLLGFSLWDVFQPNTNRMKVFFYRFLLMSICSLIIISTLFTYQHHLLDIVGGLILALVVLVVADNLRSVLVLKYIAVAIAGFLIIAIGGFFISETTPLAWFEYVSLAIGVYWLASFLLLATLYQKNAINLNKYWFRKNHQGKITLFTWLTFAPLLLAYQLMVNLSQHYASYSLANQAKRNLSGKCGRTANNREKKVTWYNINEQLLTLATPRLLSPKLVSDDLSQPSQLIVIDVAAEITSHYNSARDYFFAQDKHRKHKNLSINNQSVPTLKPTVHYLYLPLLDLQPLQKSDIAILLDLFQHIDNVIEGGYVLPNSADASSSDSSLNSSVNNSYQTPITLLNFHCVMGFSRSIAVQVLYLLYCDKLTVETARAWIDNHYPKAHLSEHYLAESLMRAMVTISHKPQDGKVLPKP